MCVLEQYALAARTRESYRKQHLDLHSLLEMDQIAAASVSNRPTTSLLVMDIWMQLS